MLLFLLWLGLLSWSAVISPVYVVLVASALSPVLFRFTAIPSSFATV